MNAPINLNELTEAEELQYEDEPARFFKGLRNSLPISLALWTGIGGFAWLVF